MRETLTLSQTSPGFYVSVVQGFRKHCGKRRNCSVRAISLFPTVFSNPLGNFLPFSSCMKLSSANSFQCGIFQNVSFGTGLTKLHERLFLGKNMLSFVENLKGCIKEKSAISLGHEKTMLKFNAILTVKVVSWLAVTNVFHGFFTPH